MRMGERCGDYSCAVWSATTKDIGEKWMVIVKDCGSLW